MLKACSDATLQIICDLMNHCLKENIFPKAWKSAKLRMVIKPGKDPTQPSGYQPISLISCVGKLYEKYINSYLLKVLTEKKFFKPIQAGYLKGRSSQEHLFRLTQDILNGFKLRQCTAGIFLDVKAAFDCVWKNGLKYKIQQIGLSKQIENLLFSFLDERTLRVFENGIWSETVNLLAGTPQGSILSPILYLIFMNGACDGLDQEKASQYADDIGIWATKDNVKEAIASIQCSMDHLERWCKRWFVTLNPIKSQLVVFTKCFRHKAEMETNDFKITLFGQNVQTIPEAIFLGVIFDQRMTWEPQFKKLTSRAYNRLNLLRRISSLARDPNPNILAQLYQAIILPVFEYSSLSIICAADVHMEKLQLLQNMALRVVSNSSRYTSITDLHDCTGFVPIKAHLTSFAKQRLDKMRRSSTILENPIAEYERVKNVQTNQSPLDVLNNCF